MSTPPNPRRWLTALAMLVGLSLVATACSDDDSADPSDTEAGTVDGDTGDVAVSVTDSAGNEVTLEALPERVVSLSPTATEMLFAIGAGDLVVAADDFSNYPPEAPTTDLSGFDPNLEAVIGFDPQLVVIQNDANDLVAGLTEAGIPVVQQWAATSLDDAYAQIEQLGALTGHVGDAAAVVSSMQVRIEELLDSVPEREEAVTFYHEVDTTYYSLNSQTFAGQLYTLAGFENIADAVEDADGFGYPQLSAEFIIDADPDVIFLADTNFENQSAETVAARDGWSAMSAVVSDRIFELDDDVVSRWGPRLVEYFEVIVAAANSMADQPA